MESYKIDKEYENLKNTITSVFIHKIDINTILEVLDIQLKTFNNIDENDIIKEIKNKNKNMQYKNHIENLNRKNIDLQKFIYENITHM